MADLFKRLLGTSNPLTSLTYWGLVLLVAAPDVLSGVFGVDLSGPLQTAGSILVVTGIRRKLG